MEHSSVRLNRHGRRLVVAVLLGFGGFAFSHYSQSAPQAEPRTSAAHRELRLIYLGNAGWQIEDGRTVILVDPYLSQFSSKRGATPNTADDSDQIVSPDKPQIDARIRQADYILITHAHLDHMLDAPYISKKTGAVILGRETTINLARAYDIDESKLITLLGGEDYRFDGFSVRAISSLHSPLWNKHYFNTRWAGTSPQGLKAPLHESAFVEGGSLAYLLRIAGRTIFIMGSMNYIEREVTGLHPDVALIGAGESRNENYDYAGRLMRALGNPSTVFPTHWDSYGSKTEEQALQNAREFANEIHAISPGTKVVIPEYFKPITIP